MNWFDEEQKILNLLDNAHRTCSTTADHLAALDKVDGQVVRHRTLNALGARLILWGFQLQVRSGAVPTIGIATVLVDGRSGGHA